MRQVPVDCLSVDILESIALSAIVQPWEIAAECFGR